MFSDPVWLSLLLAVVGFVAGAVASVSGFGIASLITHSTGARDVPVVRETLGKFAAAEAGFSAMIEAQHMACQEIDNGYMLYNRRYMYAALHWAMENHSPLCDQIRELMGGGMFQMPASVSVLNDAELKRVFDEYWTTPKESAIDRLSCSSWRGT